MAEQKRDARERRENIEMDMNPMVDLAFLLLTFFMLTTTFAQPQAMELVMPAKPKANDPVQEQPVKESKALTLVLDTLDKIVWYQGITNAEPQITNYTPNGIRKLVKEKLAEVPGLVILIKPDDDSRYLNLVDILDEMNTVNAPRYTLAELEPADRAILKSMSE